MTVELSGRARKRRTKIVERQQELVMHGFIRDSIRERLESDRVFADLVELWAQAKRTVYLWRRRASISDRRRLGLKNGVEGINNQVWDRVHEIIAQDCDAILRGEADFSEVPSATEAGRIQMSDDIAWNARRYLDEHHDEVSHLEIEYLEKNAGLTEGRGR